jgi:hypothetical protein
VDATLKSRRFQMKITKLTLSLMVVIGTGCTTVPPAPPVSTSRLPNCFDSNYDKERGLFTMKNVVGNPVNQQCLLTVQSRGAVASASRLTAGRYRVYLANGGGGGGGGTSPAYNRGEQRGGGGGGGGGGAGAVETQATINLTEGVYKLTLGAGGSGGTACAPLAGFGGGPGWLGSPSNMVRVSTGEVVIGTPGADSYVSPTRGQNEQMAGKMDAHGGSGPGQTSGGQGGHPASDFKPADEAEPGASKLASGRTGVGGEAGADYSAADKRASEGGGGGAARLGHGGEGGGESTGREDIAPEHGSLGSGGGGGKGTATECEPGARGGNGYISFRPL